MKINNKTIIGIIVLLVIIGLLLLWRDNPFWKLFDRGASNTSQSQQQTPTTQPTGYIPLTQAVFQSSIVLTDTGFSPDTITVKVNQRVTWKNESKEVASLNSDDHPTHSKFPELNQGRFEPDTYVEAYFTKPGRYTYHDHFNPQFKGTIIVE